MTHPPLVNTERASLSLENSSMTPVSTLSAFVQLPWLRFKHVHARTHTHTGSDFRLQTREVKGQTHLREETRERESSRTKAYKSCIICVMCLLLLKYFDVCLYSFYLPQCRERESEGERMRERKPEVLINHKLSLQWRNVS